MGGRKSKHQPPPVVEASPKVAVDSPTTVNKSSGFHILEIHGPTANTLVVMGLLLVLLAFIMWRTGAWRKMQAKKKREKISQGAVEEMEMEMGLPGRQRPWRQMGAGHTIRYSSPPSKTSFPSNSNQEPAEAVRMVLPILSALARKTEEEDALRRGSGRLTEIPAGGRQHQQR